MGIHSNACADSSSIDGLIDGQLGAAYADVQLVARNLTLITELAASYDLIVVAAAEIDSNVALVTGLHGEVVTLSAAAETASINAQTYSIAAGNYATQAADSANASAISAAAAQASQTAAAASAAAAAQSALDAAAVAGGPYATVDGDGRLLSSFMPTWVLGVAGLAGQVTVATFKSVVAYSKGDVGLGDVDNTSDAAKPISDATAAALLGKSDSGHNHDGVYAAATHNHDSVYQKKATISTLDPSGGAAGDIWFKVA